MSGPTRIDVDALKARINLEDLIGMCGVELQRTGKELAALCPFHREKTPSFKVTPSTQLYYCNGCGAGGDHIQFIRDRFGLGFKDAATRLAELSGGHIEPIAGDAPQRASKREPAAATWSKGIAPDDAPPAPETLRVLRDGAWSDAPVVAAWAYRTREGALLGYTCRVEFDKPDGSRGKDVIPVTWQTSVDGRQAKWRQGAMDEPRPLYGAELLASDPSANIILVEGEKACDAARRMLAGAPVLVLTWAGGCKAVDKADWSAIAGRKVVGWPDTDSQRDREGAMRPYLEQPGMAAMLRIAAILGTHGTDMRVVEVPEPDTLPDGWDLADAESEGWDRDRVLAEIRAKLAAPDALIAARALQPQPEPEPTSEEPPPAPVEDEPAPAKRRARKGDEDAPPKPPLPGPDALNDAMPVRALGFNHGRYYYLSGSQRQVHEYQKQDHSSNGMLQLAPLAFWQDTFAYSEKMKTEHWQAAVDALMRRCERAGIFDTDIIRGRGCWIDRERLVLNLGNRLMVDGDETRVDAIDSDSIYEAGPKLKGPQGEPLTVKEAGALIDIAKRFNWEMPASAALLVGWIVLAPLCGALRWRPHIWLTGGTGTGKTTILNDFMAPLLGGMELQVQGNSTEAGIRQRLRADARPVIFDESEQNDEREEQRVQNILSLIRQSSSESQSRTLKGTTSGRHLEFHIRSMFCLASIQVGIKRQADHTRMSVLGLYGTSQVPADEVDAHQAKWLETEKMLAKLRDDADYGSRLLARSLGMVDIIRENMRTLIRVGAREFKSQRLGDQYGTLLAGTAALLYDHAISEEHAERLIRAFDWSVFHESAREDESCEALSTIMQLELQVELERSKETRTIGELVRVAADNRSIDGVSPSDAATFLGRMGIKVQPATMGKDGCVHIANKSDRLTRALRGTPYASDWRGYLRRIRGAKSNPTVIRFCEGHIGRATTVPIDAALPHGE